MKKSLFLFFILNGIICASVCVLFLYIFSSNVSFWSTFGIFLLCIFTSAIFAFAYHRYICSHISAFTSKTVSEILDDGYNKSVPNFKFNAEFYPFIRLLTSQNQLIKEHIIKLKTERNTIKTLTDNMKEGFILLNSSYEILTFNKSAVIFLNSQNVNFDSDRLIAITETSPLYNAVKKALEGNANDFSVEFLPKKFQVFANPVSDDENNIFGVVVLCMDITQKKNAENAMRDFTVNVSHELKTPLTSISGYAEMIASGMVTKNEDILKFAGIIRKETARLVKLTSDIVRLSEIESNMLPSNNEEIEISQLFESTIETLTLTADNYNITIINMLSTPLYIKANRSLIEELVFNLCENAVKYNKPGGSVSLCAAKSMNAIEITVSDTGIGIPENQLENIFNRFWRVDKSRSKSSTGGTGLGLSIVKKIAEYYSGTVSATSEFGKGTSITVKLYPEISF